MERRGRFRGLAVLVLIACGGPSAPPSELPRAAPVSTAAQAPPVAAPPRESASCECDDAQARTIADAVFRQWLLTQVVDAWRPPRVVYSWTHGEQIDALRGDPTLLTRSRGGAGEISALDRALAADESELARRIREAGDGTRRFGWTTPWPTRLGWPGGDYGDRLVRIEITDDALVAVYDETRDAPEEGLYTLEGVRIPLPPPRGAEGALAREALRGGRLGLVFHTATGLAEDGTPRAFREIVIVDEAVVARWEYGTPRIRSELSQIATVLDAQRALVPEGTDAVDGAALAAELLARWQSPSGGVLRIEEIWERSLALGSERYAYRRATFDALIEALSAPPPGGPIDVVHVAGAPRRRARTGGYRPLRDACRRWDLSMGCMEVP